MRRDLGQRENREQVSRETAWPAQQVFPCGCSMDLIAAGTYRPMKFCADHTHGNMPQPRGI